MEQISGSYDIPEETGSMSADDLRHLVRQLQMQNKAFRERQQELDKLQARYWELYDNAPVGYISIDSDGIVHTANKTAATLLDLARKKLIDSCFINYIAEEDRNRYLEFLKPLAGMQPHGWLEVRLLKAGGETFYARLEGHALNRGEPESSEILLCLSDISEKKQAEDELAKARDQLRKLTAHLQGIREEERKSMAREIHDEMGQVMAYLKMSLPAIEARIPETDSETRRRINTMKEALSESIRSTRNMISRLRPYHLDELGLIPALESCVQDFREQSGIEAHFFSNGVPQGLRPEKQTTVYRILREGLSNVALHSGASRVVVSITATPKKIVLEIRDDGKGFVQTPEEAETSYGIMGMRERAADVGGGLEIDSGASRGTRLTAWFPR